MGQSQATKFSSSSSKLTEKRCDPIDDKLSQLDSELAGFITFLHRFVGRYNALH